MKQYVNEYEEALDALTSCMLDTSDIEPYMGDIVAALKKQIPMKPEPAPPICGVGSNYYCPNCYQGLIKYFRYCEECGQLLDWEDV